MDSRLRRITVLCAILMITLIVGTVAGINLWKRQNTMASPAREQAQNEKQGVSRQEEDPAVDYSAFLQDETFFDQEPSEYEKLMAQYGKKLSLAATSVEKDLRVQILNDLGEPVTGKELYITLNGEQYKDLDQDGVIYVGELKPGEYEVALEETQGYKVPSTPLTIHVKEQVEYVPIDDISLLIRTEDEIDAAQEDMAAQDAKQEGDQSQITEIQDAGANKSFGIDVSKWNKEIDWEKVRAAGAEFAIIRCGYRGSVTGALVEDPYFYQNIEGAKAAGLQVGLYFFTQAISPVEAVEEASMVLCLNDGRALDYPVFIDTESSGRGDKGPGRADGLDREMRTKVCQAFCETIRHAGYDAGIYASRNWYNQRLEVSELDSNVIWLAEYREYPEYEGKYQMWQYTSDGAIDGIEGRVDFNISYWKK